MLKDNLIMLRKLNGCSQEEIADKIGISRQAYAKWENGATVPDIEKCMLLAEIYGVTIDSLVKTTTFDGKEIIPPPPTGKSIFGSVVITALHTVQRTTSLYEPASVHVAATSFSLVAVPAEHLLCCIAARQLKSILSFSFWCV